MGSIFTKPDVRVLIQGLDAAGKTTILYKLKLGEVLTTIPTIGFNVETIEYKNITLTCWDLGGRDKARALARHYYEDTQALIYVIDSNDRERLHIAKDELRSGLDEETLRGVPLLVYCNKQDLPHSMSTAEIETELGLNSLRERQWHTQSCCAKDGDGLYEGLDWLSAALGQTENPSTFLPWRSQKKEPAKQALPVLFVDEGATESANRVVPASKDNTNPLQVALSCLVKWAL